MSRALRSTAWLAGLVVAGGLLRLAAGGDLASPPLGSLDGLTAWVDERTPVTAAVALVRLLAELSVWYVLAISGLHVLARALRVAGARRLADAVALPAVARLVRAGLGVGVVAASTLSPTEAAPGPVADTATMTPAIGGRAVAAPTAGTATMRPAPPPGGTATMEPTAPAAPRPAAPATWTVEAGDSFWTIAEEVLADALARPASEAEVDPYWRALVERNRPRLVDPADPHLLHPGQVLELPPLP